METIEKIYDLPFAPQKVYAAWVSSSTVIPPATKMDINPVVGGHYRLIMDTPEFSGRNEGTFSVVVPDQRLVYSWEWNKDGEVTQIEVNFHPIVTGTSVHIVHSGFEKDESAAAHNSGWDSYINGFIAVLEGELS
jgi:uncharacterized protein YndB with AHSA1/START domain